MNIVTNEMYLRVDYYNQLYVKQMNILRVHKMYDMGLDFL